MDDFSPVPDTGVDFRPEGQRRRLRRFGLIAAAIAILLVAVGIVSRVSATRALTAIAADASIPTVAVIKPDAGNAAGHLVLPGNVEAYNSAAIFARTNGYVSQWLADIGDHVRTGQVLAVLDAPELDQQLAQAEADYQTALANRNLAATTAQRWRLMLEKDAVSRQETDEKAGDFAAKTALANAALANVKRLKALQGFTRLTAPFDGVVTSRSAQIGALVVAGNAAAQSLFTVSDIHRVRVYVRVPQGYSAEVRPGIKAALSLPEYPGRSFPATLTRSAGAVDAKSGAVLVELQADNGDAALKPGAFAQVDFSLDTKSTGVRVPVSALLYGAEGPRLAVVDAHGAVRVKPVTIGRDEGNVVQIAAGLARGETVIDSPPDAIRTGDKVRVQNSAVGDPKAAATHG